MIHSMGFYVNQNGKSQTWEVKKPVSLPTFAFHSLTSKIKNKNAFSWNALWVGPSKHPQVKIVKIKIKKIENQIPHKYTLFK